MSDALVTVLEQAGQPNILVVGDLVLDRYVWGEAQRISPEGPIPVFRTTSEEERPGGAGNVVAALAALGAKVSLCGGVGQDSDGERLAAQFFGTATSTEGVLRQTDRPTTVKTRYIGYVQSARRGIQHMLRVDKEETGPVPSEIEEQAIRYVERVMAQQQAVVLSDYDKGFLTERLMSRIIELARDCGIPVVTDPKIGRAYSVYQGSTVLTPNRYETQIATGIAPRDADSLQRAAKALIERAGLQYAVITLDRDGMYMADADGRNLHVHTIPREVFDVTGAGDIVASVIALLLGCGVGMEEAVSLANVAAGIEVGKIGAAPVTRAEIIADLCGTGVENKVKTLEQVLDMVQEAHRTNAKIVWTNGCFDLLHIGHYEYLRFARRQGDLLVVGLNTDDSIRRLKGPNRPITGEKERARILSALDVVDAVVLFDDDTPLSIIEAIRPDVIVKGAHYTADEVVGGRFVESYGGKIALAPVIEGVSTTDIVRRILDIHTNGDDNDRQGS